MNHRFRVFKTALIGLALTLCATAQDTSRVETSSPQPTDNEDLNRIDGKIKVLLLDGQNNHRWQLTTPVLRDALESSDRFDVTVSTSPPRKSPPEDWVDWKPAFDQFDVVVSNYNGDMWPEDVRVAFESFVQNGGGFVTVHAADNAFPGWVEYNKMIGVGGWAGRNELSGPWIYFKKNKVVRDTSESLGGIHGPRFEFSVTTRTPDHPIMRGLPEKWMHTKDELYGQLRGPAENLTVLATATSTKTGNDEPQLMAIDYGEGRVFHTTLGHDVTAMLCRGFYTTLQRGTEWAATGNVTLQIPQDFPSATAQAVPALPETDSVNHSKTSPTKGIRRN